MKDDGVGKPRHYFHVFYERCESMLAQLGVLADNVALLSQAAGKLSTGNHVQGHHSYSLLHQWLASLLSTGRCCLPYMNKSPVLRSHGVHRAPVRNQKQPSIRIISASHTHTELMYPVRLSPKLTRQWEYFLKFIQHLKVCSLGCLARNSRYKHHLKECNIFILPVPNLKETDCKGHIYYLKNGANVSLLSKVSPWMAVECEKVALFRRGHSIHNLTTTYSTMSVCNLFDVTQRKFLAIKFPYMKQLQ